MGRKKPDDSYRIRVNLSFAPDLIEALRAENERTDVPMSRIVERAVRAYLKLDAEPEESEE